MSADYNPVNECNEGKKYDTGKLRYDLYTREALDEIAKVLTFGANKYGDRNWENGLSYGRVFGAIMRHLWAWWGGEDNDPETGISHVAHAGCGIIFLLTYIKRHMQINDDRSFVTFAVPMRQSSQVYKSDSGDKSQ